MIRSTAQIISIRIVWKVEAFESGQKPIPLHLVLFQFHDREYHGTWYMTMLYPAQKRRKVMQVFGERGRGIVY